MRMHIICRKSVITSEIPTISNIKRETINQGIIFKARLGEVECCEILYIIPPVESDCSWLWCCFSKSSRDAVEQLNGSVKRINRLAEAVAKNAAKNHKNNCITE